MAASREPHQYEKAPAIEQLATSECFRLLTSTDVGRLAVVNDGYPVVVPVNYALFGRAIIVRSAAGSKLHAAHRERVGFEVDQLDAATRSGWSVLVKGVAQEVGALDPERLERLRSLALVPWAPGDKNHWLHIEPIEVTGRLLTAAARG